jgi:hypothetical protein
MSSPFQAPDSLRRIADEIATALRDERNDEVRRHFSLLMKVAVPERKMRKVWQEATEMFGNPQNLKELRERRRGRFWVFDRFIDFEEGRALLSITLNRRGRVYGLFLVPASIPGESASVNA